MIFQLQRFLQRGFDVHVVLELFWHELKILHIYFLIAYYRTYCERLIHACFFMFWPSNVKKNNNNYITIRMKRSVCFIVTLKLSYLKVLLKKSFNLELKFWSWHINCYSSMFVQGRPSRIDSHDKLKYQKLVTSYQTHVEKALCMFHPKCIHKSF